MADEPSRRVFLTAALATSAGVALLHSDGGPARLEWCMRPAHPLALKACTLVRGGYPKGCVARLELWIDGPEFAEPACVAEEEVRLELDSVSWELHLPHNHERLIPGEYTYRVVAHVESETLQSDACSYVVSPFTFGV